MQGFEPSYTKACTLFEGLLEVGLTKEEQIQILKKIQTIFKDFPDFEFKNDLKTKIADLQKPASLNPVMKNALIRITDDPLELFLAGTSVKESCQRPNGYPNLNIGLLGYVKNGYNLMIRIDDERGNLLASALLKIPLNQNNKGVLFLENVYFGVSCPVEYEKSCKEAIREMAREAAKEKMEMDLIATKGVYHPQESNRFNEPVHYLECSSPCEYSDAAFGLELGAYTICRTKKSPNGINVPTLVFFTSIKCFRDETP